MKRLSLTVKGNVQGVGFRYRVSRTAAKAQVTGIVRNMEDGNVHIEIQGNEKQISDFLKFLPQGLIFARIDSIDKKEMPRDSEETRFRVKY